MPSVQHMLKSQKMMWVQRILSKASKRKKVPLNLTKIQEVDLSGKVPPKVSNSAASLFYKQVLKYWLEFYSTEHSTKYFGNERYGTIAS